MLTSLAFIFLVGLSLAAICQALKLPRIIGMLITGILLGPYVLNVLDPSILSISSELRQIALIIILLKAGLSLNLADLKKVGRPAIMMACIPATFEILAYFLLAPYFLGITRLEAAVMGAVMGAVSPAVVVPRMVQLMDEKYGTAKSIPQMILAGASCDDIYVIVLFSTFSTMAQGGSAHLKDFINIPVSIILGIALGSVAGYLLSLFFETAYAHSHMVRNSLKVIVVMGVAFLLMSIETWLKPVVSVSGLLAVGICLIWAWNSHEARNYYMFGFLTNAFYIVLLAISLMVRVPGLGLVIEFIRTLPTEHLRAWLADWRGDKALNRAYTIITALWIGVFSLRLVVQVPLYLSNQVGWLGTARLLMGIPFWALAIWVSYLIVATPMHRHKTLAEPNADAMDDNNETEEQH